MSANIRPSNSSKPYESPGSWDFLKSFKLLHILSSGEVATVYLVEENISTRLFAIKAIRKDNDGIFSNLELEKKVYHICNNPFIIQCYNIYETDKKFYFVLSYCPGGDLSVHISRARRFSEQNVRFYAAELLVGLRHIHENGIVHGNLCPENILLDGMGHLRIIDFARARLFDPEQYHVNFNSWNNRSHLSKEFQVRLPGALRDTLKLTVPNKPDTHVQLRVRTDKENYESPWLSCDYSDDVDTVPGEYSVSKIAPEASLEDYAGPHSDWWSYGIVIYMLLTGCLNLPDIEGVPEDNLLDCKLLPIPSNISVDALSLLNQLLCINPLKRLGTGVNGDSAVANHPFFRGLNWKTISKPVTRAPYVPKLSSHKDVKYFIKPTE